MLKHRSDYYALALILVILVAHILLSTQFGFGVDEAHYALYGLNPALSYFDHPPLMGWLIALLHTVTELNEFSLRLLTSLFMSLTSALLYLLTRKIAPTSVYSGLLAVGLFNLGIMVQLLGWAMVPDVVLMPLFLLLALLIPYLNNTPTLKAWLALGVLMGLCGLSKYTAIVAPLAVLIFASQQGYLLSWLKQSGLWLALLVAMAMLTPVLIWNSEHHWISFIYQIDHGKGSGWQLHNLLKILASHLALYSPLLLVAGVIGLFCKQHQSPQEKFVRWVFYLYFFMVAWASGNGSLLPHWGVVAYLFLTPIASKNIGWFYTSKAKKVVLVGLAGLSGILWLSLYGLLIFRPVTHNLHSAYYDILGWQQAGQRVQKLVKQYQIKQVLVNNWTHASRINWYAKVSPVRVLGSSLSQYDIWYGKPTDITPSLLLSPRRMQGQYNAIQTLPDGLSCRQIDHTRFILKGKEINAFKYYLCE